MDRVVEGDILAPYHVAVVEMAAMESQVLEVVQSHFELFRQQQANPKKNIFKLVRPKMCFFTPK